MRKGGGKQKGAAFERYVCKELSLWVSKGKYTDVFWRSAMSGGRATLMHMAGKTTYVCGDICAVRSHGYTFTDRYIVECKHVACLGIESFLMKNKGPLAKYWKKLNEDAIKFEKEPVLIARQNHCPDIVLTAMDSFPCPPRILVVHTYYPCCIINFTDVLNGRPPQ